MSVTKYAPIMEKASHVRNLCIMAHVDHGKTSLADSLLASNGLINPRQAGALRYLDNRPDEQRRGITMKSSVTALTYEHRSTTGEDITYLVNLIDSPGHIDFSSEVITVARISDGCLIVVDVNEGVRSQTISAIEIAVKHRHEMILVLNKIDKLIIHKTTSAYELYISLAQIIEQVNAIVVEFKKRDFYLQASLEDYDDSQNAPSVEMEGVFDPILGNVIFASAIDGWAFTLTDFARMHQKKFEVSECILTSYLWGDYYYSKSRKCFMDGAAEANKQPLGVNTVFSNIISVYKSVYLERDVQEVNRIIDRIDTSLHRVPCRNSRLQLKLLMSLWLPLHIPVFRAIVEIIKAPNALSPDKIKHIVGKSILGTETEDENEDERVENLIKSCDVSAEVLAYVAKAFAVHKRDLLQPKTKSSNTTAADIADRKKILRQFKERSIQLDKTEAHSPLVEYTEPVDGFEYCAVVRVFSGTLRKGMILNLVPPDAIPFAELNTNFVEIEQLVILLGKDYILTDVVTAGNVCGVICTRSSLVRGATLCSTICPPLIERQGTVTEPIYRCALEPINVGDMDEMLKGIKLLLQTDSCAQCVLLSSGQYILLTAGQVHLDKCIEDLRSYCSIDFQIQDPLVQYRETIMPDSSNIDSTSLNKLNGYDIELSVHNMPLEISTLLTIYYELLKSLESNYDHPNAVITDTGNTSLSDDVTVHNCRKQRNQYKSELTEYVKRRVNETIHKYFESEAFGDLRILAIGNSKTNTCVLLSKTDKFRDIWNPPNDEINSDGRVDFVGKCLVNAFHQVLDAGPITEEPLKDVICILERCSVDPDLIMLDNDTAFKITASFKKICGELLEKSSLALMEPICSADVAIDSSLIGNLQAAVAQFHGRVTSMECLYADYFIVKFDIPVVDSKRFLDTLRTTTQGKINPSLKFNYYQIVEGDLLNGRAKTLIQEIRHRKGLDTDGPLVDSAERQRTLKRIIGMILLSSIVSNVNSIEYKNWLYHFPEGSGMGLFLALALPIDLPDTNVFMAFNFEANYNLPGNSTETIDYPPIVSQDDVARFSTQIKTNINQTLVYQIVEAQFSKYGFNGRSCLLRMICEAALSNFIYNGVLGDIIHIILSPSSINEIVPIVYINAENQGKFKKECLHYSKDCDLSFLDIISYF